MYNSKPYAVKFAIAPMLDRTDRHCRYFYRLLTKKALLYSEMITEKAIVFGPYQRLLAFDEAEHPIAIQLGGSDVALMVKAAQVAYDFGYDEINLNIGCPSPRVQSGSFGAILMRSPQLVGDLVANIKAKVKLPVTIKCRIGLDGDDSPALLYELAEHALKAKIDGFWVHARNAWLKGLNPKENRNIPPLNYERVYRFRQDFAPIFVGINGGLNDLDSALAQLDKVDAVMMGRAIYSNPSLLREVDQKFYKLDRALLPFSELLEQIFAYSERHIAAGGKIQHITRHMAGLFHSRPNAKAWRQLLGEVAACPNGGLAKFKQALTLI